MKSLSFNTIYDWPIAARRLLMGILFLIVFYFGYRWSISPLTGRYDSLVQNEEDMKQQFQLIVVKTEVMEGEIVQFPALQNLLNTWQRQLPRETDLPELLSQVLKMGASHHIFFSLFDPGDQTKDVPYWHVPIKVIMVGDYDQISAFISQLANMPWIISIGKLTISDENRNDVLGAKLATMANQQSLLTAEMVLGVYYQASAAKQETTGKQDAAGKQDNAKKS